MSSSSSLRQNAHAVIIGINKYQDQKIPNLQFARADAEGIYQILTDPELGHIPPDNVILLLDEEATQRNIRSAIGDELARRAGIDDLIYIYYAGHGLPFINPKSHSADGMEKYLVPTDAQWDKIRGTGIPMDDIQRFFGWIESKQVMFFIDSCFSGEAGGRTFQNPAYQMRHGLLTDEFLDDLAGEGRLVVTACDVNEVSMETKELGHGLFTYYLIDGLKGLADKDQDGLVTIQELYDYVYEQVSKHARKLGGSMHPIQKGSIKGKLPLTQYETPAQKQARQLHTQAQSYYNAGKFGEAYELWQQVIRLVPEHAAAQHGLAAITQWWQEEQRKKQEILERKQRVLLNLYREGKLPSEEYNLGLDLVEKSESDLKGIELETRRLLDDLTAGKISVSSYLKSVGLLRKPVIAAEPKAAPEAEPKVKKQTPVAPKIEPPKRTDKKPATRKQEPPAERKRKKIIAGSIGLAVILVVLAALFWPQEEQRVVKPIVLRKTPAILSVDEVKAMLAEKNFYNSAWNEDGEGITHNYVEKTLNGDKVVLDKTTGLMWQQSGSPTSITYAEAKNYIRELNGKSFAGFDDWRLPTLEEAMSLMEREKKNGDLYIDPKFDQNQWWIWTADKESAGRAWVVDGGDCDHDGFGGSSYVRAVRSGQSIL